MDLFEYQARDLFEAGGVPVLRGIVARTPEAAHPLVTMELTMDSAARKAAELASTN